MTITYLNDRRWSPQEHLAAWTRQTIADYERTCSPEERAKDPTLMAMWIVLTLMTDDTPDTGRVIQTILDERERRQLEHTPAVAT